MRSGDMILLRASTEFEDLATASASATGTLNVRSGAHSDIAFGVRVTCYQQHQNIDHGSITF